MADTTRTDSLGRRRAPDQERGLKHSAPLEAGEISTPVRIRAPTWVHDRLRSMSAAQIGQLLETTLQQQEDA